MKRKHLFVLLTTLVLVLTACTVAPETSQPAPTPTAPLESTVPTASSSPESRDPAPAFSSEPAESLLSTPEKERILIAYFTWAENTVVEDPSAVDVDATTSASVLLPGNAAKLASWIQQEAGGDLFSIVVVEPYSSDYDECLDRAADEKAQNARPELQNHVEDMGQYDTIILGYPNWWASIPMPIATFLEEYDFAGKTIVPFCSHGGGRFGQSLTAIAKLAPDAVMGEGLAINYSGGASMPEDVADWLEANNLG